MTESTSYPPATSATRWARIIVPLVAALCLLGASFYFYRANRDVERTDDAYVETHATSVTAKVAAYVSAVRVEDNSRVNEGDVLIELDDRDFVAAIDIQRAGLAVAQSKRDEAQSAAEVADADAAGAEAEVSVAKAKADLATADFHRFNAVADSRAVSVQILDAAKSAMDASQAELSAAETRVRSAQAKARLSRSQIATAAAAVQNAQAALAQAELNLTYTRVVATQSGTIANKLVQMGNYVQPGQLLFVLVPDDVYVTANFKETQLTRIRPGARVEVRVDAYPDLKLQGRIDSIQRGTGSRFAVLPPENATGNFIKVVQRVPVKIVPDGSLDEWRRLVPGMSVETTVQLQ
jgi:membrane fusion protein (multidrug efflux system)